MKAIVYASAGSPDAVRCEEIQKPTPGDGEVLIKVRAASVNPADWRVLTAPPAIRRVMFRIGKAKVKRPGYDVAGQVEAVGANVTRLKPGDEVFGVCHGAFAEYACTAETKLAIKPPGVTFEQAASVPIAAVTALQGLRDHAHLQPGQNVLINGAAGGVGTFSVQIAKSLGAQVTGVCSTGNVEMVRSLGADRVIDYTREDFTQDAQRYDVILDNVGNRSLSACRRVMKPNGICVMAGAPKEFWIILARMLQAPVVSWLGSRKFIFFIARIKSEDLGILGELMAAGTVTPIIDRRYPLSQVAEALRYLETGHARAKVVISVSD
ncbi:MAG: NAD(P)-dependent alcohol dehydrogenase [Terriglobales bacterium]